MKPIVLARGRRVEAVSMRAKIEPAEAGSSLRLLLPCGVGEYKELNVAPHATEGRSG